MKLLWLLAVVACGQGGARASGGLDTATLEDVQLAFEGDDVRIELTLLGKDGKPLRFVNASVGPSVEFELRETADGDAICKGSFYIHEKERDAKTGRVVVTTQFRAVPDGTCREELVKKNYAGKPYLSLDLGENGRTLKRVQQLTAFSVPDTRPPMLPALDAEIASLEKQIGDIDPVLVLPPCTPALAGTERLDAVDQALFMPKLPPGTQEAWPWLRSPLFFAIESYKKREYEKPDELVARLQKARKILVFVADKHLTQKQTDEKSFEPGVFEGWIDVLDRDAGKAVCAIKLAVLSSETIAYTRRMTKKADGTEEYTQSDAATNLRVDFFRNMNTGVAAALDKAGIGAVRPRLSEIEMTLESYAPAK